MLSESEEPVSWSWNGNLRCEVPVLNTGFTTGQVTTTVSLRILFDSGTKLKLQIQDYIVLSLLVPPGPLACNSALRRPISIRLATERWIDRS